MLHALLEFCHREAHALCSQLLLSTDMLTLDVDGLLPLPQRDTSTLRSLLSEGITELRVVQGLLLDLPVACHLRLVHLLRGEVELERSLLVEEISEVLVHEVRLRTCGLIDLVLQRLDLVVVERVGLRL